MLIKSPKAALWPLYALTLLISSSLIAWHLLAKIDFAYPQAYKLLDIDEHISRFAPQNRYRPQFELTSEKERLELFSEVITSIQHNGKGLATIAYTHADKRSTLFREAEVMHLEAVANLVDHFYFVGTASIIATIILFVLIRQTRPPLLKPKQLIAGILLLALTITVTFIVVGPRKLYQWLHTQFFPENDQWFFYYQDSLMTTLMKAPDLFGFIGILLGVVTLLIYSCLFFFTLKSIRN